MKPWVVLLIIVAAVAIIGFSISFSASETGAKAGVGFGKTNGNNA